MKNKNVTGLFLMCAMIAILSLSVLAAPAGSGACTYTSPTAGNDYFGINTETTNTTNLGADTQFISFSAFTPRLNFSRPIASTVTGGNISISTVPTWLIYDNNCNTSLVLSNNSQIIDSSNYTYVTLNRTAGTWKIDWTVNNYYGKTITLSCNRTFVKNVDDLTTPETTINTATIQSYWLTTNSPSTYGQQKTWKFNGALYGQYVNNSNWAVEWVQTNRTCSFYTADDAQASVWDGFAKIVHAMGTLAGIIAFALVILAMTIIIGVAIETAKKK